MLSARPLLKNWICLLIMPTNVWSRIRHSLISLYRRSNSSPKEVS